MFEIEIRKVNDEQCDEMVTFNILSEDTIKSLVPTITDAMVRERKTTAFRMEE